VSALPWCSALHPHSFSALGAPSRQQEWVELITRAWVSCVKHATRTARGSGGQATLLHRGALLQAENARLRSSLAAALSAPGTAGKDTPGQAAEGRASPPPGGASTVEDGWIRKYLAPQGKVAHLAGQLDERTAYEVQVVTGKRKASGRTWRTRSGV
jgi:hypothetical protein